MFTQAGQSDKAVSQDKEDGGQRAQSEWWKRSRLHIQESQLQQGWSLWDFYQGEYLLRMTSLYCLEKPVFYLRFVTTVRLTFVQGHVHCLIMKTIRWQNRRRNIIVIMIHFRERHKKSWRTRPTRSWTKVWRKIRKHRKGKSQPRNSLFSKS